MGAAQSRDGVLRSATRAPVWPTTSSASNSVDLYGTRAAYAEVYRRQPNVRTCVDFLARNVAQLAPHVFRRRSDTDRVRLADHDVARWLAEPNAATSRYRFQESLVADLALYFNAFHLKARYEDGRGRPAVGLVRIPPPEMSVTGGLLPQGFIWRAPDGSQRSLALNDVVYINGYNPTDPLMGLSPLETLRGILAEEAAASTHREGFWRNSARIDGVVTRPKEKPRYNETQLSSWVEQWQLQHSGGLGSGRTLLLQDGETFTPAGWSAKDAEFIAARKLSREECAAAWHIPLPLVGILEHATFSNIKEQHKHLYQDCLGPWLELIEEEWERQLLSESEDQADVYLEFNIAAKLAGSFEESADALHRAVGRPWMTANEARARQNLPRIDDPDADTLAAQQGGPAAYPTASPERADAATPLLATTRARQLTRLRKLPRDQRVPAFHGDLARWTRELTHDLTPIVGEPEAARRAERANAQLLTELLRDEEQAA